MKRRTLDDFTDLGANLYAADRALSEALVKVQSMYPKSSDDADRLRGLLDSLARVRVDYDNRCKRELTDQPADWHEPIYGKAPRERAGLGPM